MKRPLACSRTSSCWLEKVGVSGMVPIGRYCCERLETVSTEGSKRVAGASAKNDTKAMPGSVTPRVAAIESIARRCDRSSWWSGP